VRLTERALLDPVFVEIVGQRQVTLPLLGAVPNYNALLGANGVFGIKTGSTGRQAATSCSPHGNGSARGR